MTKLGWVGTLLVLSALGCGGKYSFDAERSVPSGGAGQAGAAGATGATGAAGAAVVSVDPPKDRFCDLGASGSLLLDTSVGASLVAVRGDTLAVVSPVTDGATQLRVSLFDLRTRARHDSPIAGGPPQSLSMTDRALFWTIRDEAGSVALWRWPLDASSAPQPVYADAPGGSVSTAATDDRLFFVRDRVAVVSRDEQGREEADFGFYPTDLVAAAQGEVYFSQCSPGGRIGRFRHVGRGVGEAETVTGVTCPSALVGDDQDVFFSEKTFLSSSSESVLTRVKVGGGAPQPFGNVNSSVYQLDLDATHVLVRSEHGLLMVERATGHTVVIPGGVAGAAFDASCVYSTGGGRRGVLVSDRAGPTY